MLHLSLSTGTVHPVRALTLLKHYSYRLITRLLLDHSSPQSLHTVVMAEQVQDIECEAIIHAHLYQDTESSQQKCLQFWETIKWVGTSPLMLKSGSKAPIFSVLKDFPLSFWLCPSQSYLNTLTGWPGTAPVMKTFTSATLNPFHCRRKWTEFTLRKPTPVPRPPCPDMKEKCHSWLNNSAQKIKYVRPAVMLPVVLIAMHFTKDAKRYCKHSLYFHDSKCFSVSFHCHRPALLIHQQFSGHIPKGNSLKCTFILITDLKLVGTVSTSAKSCSCFVQNFIWLPDFKEAKPRLIHHIKESNYF